MVKVLARQIAVGTAFNTYTTAKSVLNSQAKISMESNNWYVGYPLLIDVWGALSNIVTTPGTVTFNVKLGAVSVFTTGAIQLNATAHTLLPFHLNIGMILNAVGSGTTAKFRGQGTLQGVMFTLTAAQVDAANVPGVFSVPATAPAVGTGFDSTVDHILDFHVGFSISNAGNGVTIHQYTVQTLEYDYAGQIGS